MPVRREQPGRAWRRPVGETEHITNDQANSWRNRRSRVTRTATHNNRPVVAVRSKKSVLSFLGAEAIKRDNQNAAPHFCHTGHFALEAHTMEIAGAIQDFLRRKLGAKLRHKRHGHLSEQLKWT